MANVNQIYTLLNNISSELVGGNAITVKDTSSFISFGDQVLSTDENRDMFYNKLCDRIGKTVVKARALKHIANDIVMDTMTFGMALQRIQSNKIARLSRNDSWNDWQSVEGSDVNLQNKDPFDVTDKTDIQTKIFSKRGVFEVEPKQIFDYQLDIAFTNEGNFASFVNLIYQDMYNGMELALRDMYYSTIATSMAETLNSNNTKAKRNLLAEYNATIPAESAITVAQCLTNKDFLRFASKEINLVIKKLADVSTLYNTEHAERWSDSDMVVVKMLSDFEVASDEYLSSDTFHKDLVALPGHSTQNYWQGTGEAGSFADCSKIDIMLDETEVSQSGILATVFDKDRIGILFDRIRTKSVYNPRQEATNLFHKADIGKYLDNSYSSIVFYVEDAQ